jgi:hypothetical protein
MEQMKATLRNSRSLVIRIRMKMLRYEITSILISGSKQVVQFTGNGKQEEDRGKAEEEEHGN